MTTKDDILAAKRTYEDHRGFHRCRLGDGCQVRVRLWLRYMAICKEWGR